MDKIDQIWQQFVHILIPSSIYLFQIFNNGMVLKNRSKTFTTHRCQFLRQIVCRPFKMVNNRICKNCSKIYMIFCPLDIIINSWLIVIIFLLLMKWIFFLSCFCKNVSFTKFLPKLWEYTNSRTMRKDEKFYATHTQFFSRWFNGIFVETLWQFFFHQINLQ